MRMKKGYTTRSGIQGHYLDKFHQDLAYRRRTTNVSFQLRQNSCTKFEFSYADTNADICDAPTRLRKDQ